ncbi:MAG TPA: hypothetical protein VGH40_11050 [Roseiarcus sp.]
MRELLVAKFDGQASEQHKLPAYEAVQSLYGIARSVLIITNYVAEGRVRRKEFNPEGFELNIIAQRAGSFETVFELVTDPMSMTIIGGLGLSVAGNFVTDVIKSVFQRAIGKQAQPDIEALESSGKLSGGDMAALVDAIEPAMKNAHRSVNKGASNIFIIAGDGNYVTLNQASKDYVNSSIRDERIRAKLFSVASFNANSGYGRAFDYEEGRTIPFVMQHDADRKTIDTILGSMSSYARRRHLGDDLRTAVAFQYRATLSVDGRVKMLNLMKARQEISDLQ